MAIVVRFGSCGGGGGVRWWVAAEMVYGVDSRGGGGHNV